MSVLGNGKRHTVHGDTSDGVAVDVAKFALLHVEDGDEVPGSRVILHSLSSHTLLYTAPTVHVALQSSGALHEGYTEDTARLLGLFDLFDCL